MEEEAGGRSEERGTATDAGAVAGTPRMPVMSATMNSARFVGRDAAFVRLAPELESACFAFGVNFLNCPNCLSYWMET